MQSVTSSLFGRTPVPHARAVWSEKRDCLYPSYGVIPGYGIVPISGQLFGQVSWFTKR